MSRNRDEYGLIKVIKKLEIFGALSEEESLHILRMCNRRTFAAGDVIWRPGDAGLDMLVLITGRLHVVDDDGKVLGQVLPGASFGEMACLTGNNRFVGFEAVDDATALSLSRQALQGLIVQEPQLYVKILEKTIELLAHRVRRASLGGIQSAVEGEPTLW